MKTTNGKFKTFAETFIPKYEEYKEQVKGSTLLRYNLIKLKKKVESEYQPLVDAYLDTLKVYGIEPDENGRFEFDMREHPDLVKDLEAFADKEIEFDIPTIELSEDSDVPMALMDILFDYITIKEN